MNLQFDLCCSDFSFTNTTSRNPSLHKRKREHGRQRAQRGLLSDRTSDQPFAHCEPVSASAPKHRRRKGENGRPPRVRWDKPHKRSWCPEPCGGSGLLQSVLLAAPAQSLSWNCWGRGKGTHDQVSRLTRERPGSKSRDNGPSFTLERLCPVYFTLIYICTGNNKRLFIIQQFSEFYLVSRIMHAITNER